MSLQIWLPLKGNLENYGLTDISFSNENLSTLTINNSGKIGKCYQRETAKTAGRITSSSNILLDGDLSMCCWAKVTTTAGNSANGLITNHSHADNTGFGITVKQISADDYRISCNTGNGSGRTYYTYYGTTNIKGAWHHLALTYNNTTKIFQLWVDGQVENTQSYTNSAKADKIMLFDWSTTYNSTNYRPACCLNDVRIYNHCLSAKEVEELAKGLILHYKFDGGVFQGNPNLGKTSANYSNQTLEHAYAATGWGGDAGTITYYSSGGYNNLPYKVYHKTATGSGGIYRKTANDIVIESGKTYTMSCWIKASRNFSESSYGFNINRQVGNRYINYGKSLSLTTEWQFFSKTFTATDDDAGDYGEMSIIYNDAETDYYVYYSGFKIEYGEFATAWIDPNEEIENIIYDSSGYCNHGAINGKININSESVRYNNSTALVSTGYNTSGQIYNYIYTPLSMQEVSNITFAFWYKRSSSYNRGGFIALDTNTTFSNYTSCALNCFDSYADFYDTNSTRIRISSFPTSILSDNQWHYYILEYSANNKVKLYRDNVEIKNVNAGGALKAFSYLGLNYSQAGGGKRGETCQFSDFRVYTTILTDQQKIELYNVSVSIDSKGNVYPRELVEE